MRNYFSSLIKSLFTMVLANYAIATVPEDVKEHIIAESAFLNAEHQKYQNKNLEALLIDNFIKGLKLFFPSTNQHGTTDDELRALILDQVAIEPASLKKSDAKNTRLAELSKLGVVDGAMLFVSVDNQLVPLEISDSGAATELAITGVNNHPDFNAASYPRRCLSVRLDFTSKTVFVNWIGAEYSACALPREKTGTFLVNLADTIAHKLGFSQLQLTDMSKIRCHHDGKYANFALLRQMQKGRSWYEEFGYSLIDYPENYRTALRKFRTTLLEQLQQIVTEVNAAMGHPDDMKLVAETNLKRSFEQLGSNFASRRAAAILKQWRQFETDWRIAFPLFVNKIDAFSSTDKPKTLASFFSWLWSSDCESYNKIVPVLFSELAHAVGISIHPSQFNYTTNLQKILD